MIKQNKTMKEFPRRSSADLEYNMSHFKITKILKSMGFCPVPGTIQLYIYI